MSNVLNHDEGLALAYIQAERAVSLGEVPVGALLVKNGQVIVADHNLKESNQDPMGHAECRVIQRAAKVLESWRLDDCQLYVTLEPCVMCAGAIIQARIPTVIYGAKDPKGGAFGSVLSLHEETRFNHQVSAIYHPHALSSEILSSFFKRLRR